MKVVDPGHAYALLMLDSTREAFLRFVKREGEGYPGNSGHYAGTNMQEVMRALIDRLKYLNDQIPDRRNHWIIGALRESISLLEERAAERHGRPFPKVPFEIETVPFCPKCGHIGCKGECHE